MMVKIVLLLAAKSLGNFAEQLVLFLPPRFQCPREDLLEMVAVVDGRVKEDPLFVKKCWALFGSG